MKKKADGDPETLSPIERLPRELISEIIHFVPQSLFRLRLTSRMLEFRVAEVVMDMVNNIQKIKDIVQISEFRLSKKQTTRTLFNHCKVTIDISLKVQEANLKLFDLYIIYTSPIR
ncbi:hypothetical protein PMAYCL1PPCAC_19873, partial [Pristionchus mayeri]